MPLTAPRMHMPSQPLTAPDSPLQPLPVYVPPPSSPFTHPHAPLHRYASSSTVGKAERLQAYQQQLQLVKNFVTRDHKKAQKVEKRLELTLGGYRKRTATLRTEIVDKQQARRAVPPPPYHTLTTPLSRPYHALTTPLTTPLPHTPCTPTTALPRNLVRVPCIQQPFACQAHSSRAHAVHTPCTPMRTCMHARAHALAMHMHMHVRMSCTQTRVVHAHGHAHAHAHVPYAYATHVQACHEKRLELGCFEMLQQQEALARPQRLAQMGTLVSEQSVREAQLQASYAELLRKRDSLLAQLHP